MTRPDGPAAAPVDPVRLAAQVRDACVRVFAEAYQEGGMVGLCAEGRLEAALGAVRSLDAATLSAATSDVPPNDAQDSTR